MPACIVPARPPAPHRGRARTLRGQAPRALQEKWRTSGPNEDSPPRIHPKRGVEFESPSLFAQYAFVPLIPVLLVLAPVVALTKRENGAVCVPAVAVGQPFPVVAAFGRRFVLVNAGAMGAPVSKSPKTE